MQEHTTIPFPLPQLTAEDPLTEVLRQGEGRVERTPPVFRCALYSPFLPPFGPGSVTVFHPALLCASPSQKPACGFPAQASSAGH
jgi:hypothetical protein